MKSPKSALDIESLGIVGAGGAGFPLAKKLDARVDTYIVNAAECEPLLHKDQEMILAYADEMLEGLRIAMERVGAKEGVIGIKAKYVEAVELLKSKADPVIRFCLLGTYYPAGDEFILVFEATGKVIPPGGLPLNVGCIVSNVETLINLGRGRPVTRKYLTVCGAVRNPVTIEAPIGATLREAMEAAGGPTVESYGALTGGVMMGKLVTDFEAPIVKTTGALIVLPTDHVLLRRYGASINYIRKIAKSACDQCSFCTELCPRYLLGHPIEPHLAMRAEGFATEQPAMVVGTQFCCECNLCTMIACPEDLDPKNVCVIDKGVLKKHGTKWDGGGREVKPHPMFAFRRTPVSRLKAKMALNKFNDVGPMAERPLETRRVRIPLSQHIGAPCQPVVSVGAKVREGDLIGKVPEKALGAPVHASIDGRVTAVNEKEVVIER